MTDEVIILLREIRDLEFVSGDFDSIRDRVFNKTEDNYDNGLAYLKNIMDEYLSLKSKLLDHFKVKNLECVKESHISTYLNLSEFGIENDVRTIHFFGRMCEKIQKLWDFVSNNNQQFRKENGKKEFKNIKIKKSVSIIKKTLEWEGSEKNLQSEINFLYERGKLDYPEDNHIIISAGEVYKFVIGLVDYWHKKEYIPKISTSNDKIISCFKWKTANDVVKIFNNKTLDNNKKWRKNHLINVEKLFENLVT